jgi:integrase
MYFINYSLHNQKSKKETSIFLFVTHNKRRLKLSSREKIHPHMWDTKNKRIAISDAKLKWYSDKAYGSVANLKGIQKRLNDLRSEVDLYFLNNSNLDGNVSINKLRIHLLGFLNPECESHKIQLVRDYTQSIKDEMAGGYRRKPDGKKYTAGTIECYHTFIQVLKMYENYVNKRIGWEDIDKNFYLNFIQWNETRGVSINYTGRLIKDIKCIMRTAYEEGIHVNDDFRKRYFSVPKENKKKVPFTLDEIQNLTSLCLDHSKGLSLARNIFVFGSFVGLRISDIKRLKPIHVKVDDNGYHLSIKTQKTGVEVKIPLNSIALSILQKYDFSFPKYSEQSINRNLKIIGGMIGIGELRASVLSIHYARHSFARLAYEQGVPSMYIMKVTGHQTEKSFMNYINISLDQAMDEFRKIELFK